jgi:exodeoxyribonuclease VII large subunit
MTALFLPPGAKVISVSELTRDVKTLLEEAFARVWVSGEVSGFKRHGPSGHWYLTLKDAGAQLRAAMFRGSNLRVKFDVHDGMKVIARGRLSVYEQRGDYQLYIEELQPEGIGPLELAFRQLKEKLSVKGYFEPSRKKPLPAFPRRIVLVTSPSGAAVRDMLEILGQRWPAVEVWICPVPVQGDGAAEKIADAIRLLNRLQESGVRNQGSGIRSQESGTSWLTPDSCLLTPAIDVLIVARGGGSLEDLWAFNEECVAHAIFESRIPIISGVGHETDYTIADMVADRRAETPTAAAMCVVRDWRDEEKRLRNVEQRLRDRIDRRVEWARQRLTEVSNRPCFRQPLRCIRELEQRLDDTAERLTRGVRQSVAKARQRIEATAARLETLSPLNVLRRGYSLTRKESDQSVVRRADQVSPGERIVTLVEAGRLVSRVESSDQ